MLQNSKLSNLIKNNLRTKTMGIKFFLIPIFLVYNFNKTSHENIIDIIKNIIDIF